jgi:hypothetical protein
MGAAELPGPAPGNPLDFRRRTRIVRLLRLALLAFVVAYFFMPYEVHYWIPAWIPFIVAVYLEAQFFLGGWLQGRRSAAYAPVGSDHGPQPRDLADFGGEDWRETTTIVLGGERHYVPIGGLTDEEVDERVEAYVRDPDALRAARRPYRRPAERTRRLLDRRSLLEALAMLAVVGGILYWAVRPHGWSAVSAENQARAEALFSREAAKIAGHPAVVRCDMRGDYVGFLQDADGLAFVGGRRAYLTPSICDTLYQLAFKHRTQSFPRTARALAVLAHEAWHLQGVGDEGLTNCYAFQSGVQLGVDLGLSEGTARSMMRQQLATNASDAASAPEYLVPEGCRDGGEHDLDPGSSAFP